MGYVIGFFLIASAIFLAGAAVGRFTTPDRGPRKRELKRARETLAELDTLIAGASMELGMLGSDVAEKGGDILRKYWRGDSA